MKGETTEKLSWNQNLSYSDYKNPPLVPIESQLNPIEISVSRDVVPYNLVGAYLLSTLKMAKSGSSEMLVHKFSSLLIPYPSNGAKITR